ncbi:hypothetical protein AX016_2235 [Cellulophaga sp. RHA19]|nr:hypothetical protein AX016_2235 [Cellulophaga sp. RHA19]
MYINKISLIFIGFFFIVSCNRSNSQIFSCFTDDNLLMNISIAEEKLISNKFLVDNSPESYKKLFIRTITDYDLFKGDSFEELKKIILPLNLSQDFSSKEVEACFIAATKQNPNISKILEATSKIDEIRMSGNLPEGFTYENFDMTQFMNDKYKVTWFEGEECKLIVLINIYQNIKS